MTLWRRVTPTIVRVSLLTAFFGTVATFTVIGHFMTDRTIEHTQALMEFVRGQGFADRCEAFPAGWKATLRNGDALETFDLAKLPASVRESEPGLLREIESGAPVATQLKFLQNYGGVLLMRLAPSGPCSLVKIQWRIEVAARFQVLLSAVGVAILSALLIGLVSAAAVVRPLISRIQRLNAAAGGIGEGASFQSAGDPSDDELGALSRVLDDAHERIQSTTRQLLDRHQQLQLHLADIAHDLKTPLTAVQLTLEQAARTTAGAEMQETISRCMDDCVYLAAMIDNLRVGTQLRDGLDPAANGARSELRETVRQVVRRLEFLGRYKGLEVNMACPEEPVWGRCRPLVVERVIDNLVYNAVSHARTGDHVAVLLEADGSRFRLTVLDDGPGLPPDELAALGSRYFRGTEAELRAPRGTGLGLSIVAEVCRRCGWELVFEANDPCGLRVVVSGPIVPSELANQPAA